MSCQRCRIDYRYQIQKNNKPLFLFGTFIYSALILVAAQDRIPPDSMMGKANWQYAEIKGSYASTF
jgi:hypothetical protein